MGNSPLVTVIMTAYNSEKFIAEAINSILSQTYSNWELLVADDYSTDNTKSILKQFTDPRIKITYNSENLHYLRSRNILIQDAKGEYITLLDADDTCSPDRIKLQLKEFEKDQKLALVGCYIQYIDENGKILNYQDHKPLSYEEIRTKIQYENVFTGSTIMVRRDIWMKVGGYRDFFNSFGYEDYDLTSRIVEQFNSINLPEKLYNYRQVRNSFTKVNLLYNPLKLHGQKLIQKFIEERKLNGKDSLELGDYPKIINFIFKKHQPYVSDQSMIHRHLMWGFVHRRHYLKAFYEAMIAIFKRPLYFNNYRSLAAFIYYKLFKQTNASNGQ